MDIDDFNLSETDRAFQQEVREWLSGHLVGDFAAARGIGGISDDNGWDIRVAWDHELAADRWLCIGWPQKYGGRDATLTQEIIFHLEYAEARAPYRAGSNGQDLFGPMLLLCGSESLKERFLPPISGARAYWGQGFSEPGAGSDLASVQTRAQLDGNEWVIDGQKIWTSLAHRADWLYVLCKSDLSAPRHHNLTMLIVDAHAAGVDIRPIRNLSGGGEFCEVFLNGVRTSQDLVIGDVGGGWNTAMSTLGIERGVDLLPHQLTFERELGGVIDAAKLNGALGEATIRERVVECWMDLEAMRSMTSAMLKQVIDGGSPGYAGSISKLFASRWRQRLGELAMEIDGLESEVVGEDYNLNSRQRIFLDSRSETIYGGSSEIQRNILSERVLGMPRELRPLSESAAS